MTLMAAVSQGFTETQSFRRPSPMPRPPVGVWGPKAESRGPSAARLGPGRADHDRRSAYAHRCRQVLLQVVLHVLRGAGARLGGILPELPLGLSLPQQVPALVQLLLEDSSSLAALRR